MNELSSTLKTVYNADACVLIPGGGSYAMESVARQFATGNKCLVIRDGWFSYRWTQIFEAGVAPSSSTVLKARRASEGATAPFSPAPLEEVVAAINTEKPDVVFAPHVETSAGMILPVEYMRAVADAVHANGGMFVLDCVASGCIWVDIKAVGVDVLITAPQKGWSSTPCAGVVMLSELAVAKLADTTSTSFVLDLKKWHQIMGTYENGGHAYHTTLPTDSIVQFLSAVKEVQAMGFEAARAAQQELGDKIRALLVSRGFPSVAAEGFQAPGVVVSYTSDAAIKSGQKFAANGMQIASGVPLQCDEGSDFQTFRIGLFGLDKLLNVDAAVARFEEVLNRIA
eukprot:CAMPEP_0116893858 /NCGR_PEP_ID=MMETSP0467-20121206/3757_1 /TAXON_ID=283647 /ORGANISM="Mesodinium pulex, Strain SPMC105" /LENGTH=340 /DNA_ID=CAMNT_0004563759 /DNA_START=141 /DNA_END=1163 /DNA_ORIENTATION=-